MRSGFAALLAKDALRAQPPDALRQHARISGRRDAGGLRRQRPPRSGADRRPRRLRPGAARSGAPRAIRDRLARTCACRRRSSCAPSGASPMTRPVASSALSHLRVLDLTRVRAGPTCCRILADFGADVIKIEAPPGVDPNEGISGARHGYDMINLHRNKRSMTLNLKESAGRDVFMRMVKTADAVVENFRPDVKDRLGIGYDALKAVNPRVILASISGFGQTGPYKTRAGFDQIAQGMGGLMGITGEPGTPPMRAGIAIADSSAGV